MKEPSAKYLARPRYRQTEVGVIPEEWLVKPLGEIAHIKTGGRNNQDKIEEGEYPFFVRSEKVERINSYSYDCEAILVPGEGGIGSIFHYIHGRFDVHQRVYAITQFAPEVSGRYVYFYMTEKFGVHAMQNSVKATVDSLRLPTFQNFKIAIPSTANEQSAIAEALSDTDALIESLEELLTKKRQVKQGAMQELLTGKKRLPGFSGEWEVKQLGDVVDTDPENLGSDTRPNFPFNYVALEDVDGGTLSSYSEQVFHTAPSRARRLLRKHDVLVSTVRPNLMSHLLFTADGDNWVCSTGFCVVRCREGVSHPGYVYFHMFAACVARQIEALLTGSNYPSINSGDVRALQVPFPEYKEQATIAAILSDMDYEIVSLDAKLAKARQVKQGMMQELLTGRIRLVQPDANVVQLPTKKESAPVPAKSHNWQINEAVVISVLAKHFGSDRFPLGRKRCTKLSYLLHRHVEHLADGYLKKAAGPYNPAVKYKGPEGIAQKNGYIRPHQSGQYAGFVAAEKIAQAEAYFAKWYGNESLTWLEQFRLKTNEDLELLTTVDMAMVDLREEGKAVHVANVKRVIQDHPEWEAKLDRAIFSDDGINRVIESCRQLFGSGE